MLLAMTEHSYLPWINTRIYLPAINLHASNVQALTLQRFFRQIAFKRSIIGCEPATENSDGESVLFSPSKPPMSTRSKTDAAALTQGDGSLTARDCDKICW